MADRKPGPEAAPPVMAAILRRLDRATCRHCSVTLCSMGSIIRTNRLDLVSMSPAFIEAVLAGDRANAEATAGPRSSRLAGRDTAFLRRRLTRCAIRPRRNSLFAR
jgi:hypothetical protein